MKTISVSASLFAATLLLAPALSWAGGTVNNCTEAELRAAMTGGGTVTFACDGTITLANTITTEANTLLDATGHQVTINGNNTVQVFYVGTNVNLTVVSLAIVNGRSVYGGAIYNNGGTLNLSRVSFLSNNAAVPPLWNLHDGFRGGAIWNAGTLHASQCIFLRNRAAGPKGRDGASGSDFFSPRCGSPGYEGLGGAIYNDWSGAMTIDSSLFASNSAAGSDGGNGGDGWVPRWGGVDQTGGCGAPGGYGSGAAIHTYAPTSAVKLINSTFVGNEVAAGNGGRGGNAGWYGNLGFRGGDGGPSWGGGYGVIGGHGVQMVNCTVALNSAMPAKAGTGGLGSLGMPNGSNGPLTGGPYGGIEGGSLVNTLLATNEPGGNCHAGVNDLGHNLSSDGSGGFTDPSSLTNTNPKLGPLTDNGGPTLTMALLSGSPAIDAGDTAAAPATDQRGFPRPNGVAADIGAYEYGSMMPVLTINQSSPTDLDILVRGNANQSCRLLTSPNFLVWTPIATNNIGLDGTVSFHVNCNTAEACRYYRVSMQ